MADRKEINMQVFQDTKKIYMSDPELHDAVMDSIMEQWCIIHDDVFSIPEPPYSGKANVIVSGKRTVEAAVEYARQGKKVCLLNFASATHPGGGVEHGASAQEESICRITTLYHCLANRTMHRMFYLRHQQQKNPMHNDDCIYTPNVYVIKSDESIPKLLPKSEWQKVNVISCAAPNLYGKPRYQAKRLERLLTSRIKRIFDIAAFNGNEVLILGAFGCGAFHNPPKLVAKVFSDVMKDYLNYFETIEYAVYHKGDESANFDAFCEAMKEYE